MSITEADAANMALGHLGIGGLVGDLDTDTNQESVALKLFREIARKSVLSDGQFDFAKKTATLTLDTADPTTEWAYSYVYPTDCVFFRRILSGKRNDTRASRIPFLRFNAASGQRIYTDMEDAVGEYIVDVSDISKWPMEPVIALTYRWAALAARRITGGDPFKLGPAAMEMYMKFELPRAKASSASESQRDLDPENELTASRN